MGTLYFLNRDNEKTVVATGIREKETGKYITDFVRRLNPDFKIHYMRLWKSSPKTTTYDVGSHTEFFEFVED